MGLWLATRIGPDSARFALDIGVPTFLAAIVLGTASSLIGAIIVGRRPGNTVGWLYVATGVLQGVVTTGLAYAALTLPTRPDELATFMVWINGIVDFAVPFSFAALVLALFPDGSLVGPQWRIVPVMSVGGALLRAAEVGLGSPTLVLLDGAANPHRLGGPLGQALATSASLGIGSLLVEGAFALAATSLAVRYRASTLDGQRQILWLLMAGVVALLSSLPLLYATVMHGALPSRFDSLALIFGTLTLAPVATLIAITRYRLYEIDRIVNRALVYGSLSAILAGVFTAGIALAQRLFVALTNEKSDAAIVLTTLVVATLYAPLRKRLEAVVDRRFKFDDARFGAYREELLRMLSLTDPSRAAARLASEAVRELGAAGGAVLDRAGTPLATAGRWPIETELAIPIPRGASFGSLVLGPRADGEALDPRVIAQVEELASLAALAATPETGVGTTRGGRARR